MTYNYTNASTPSLNTRLSAANDVDLVDGSPQGDYITNEFAGGTVTVTIVPPSGWTISVDWSSGSGTLTVPDPGVEVVHSFDYTIKQGTVRKSNGGVFKIKKAGGS